MSTAIFTQVFTPADITDTSKYDDHLSSIEAGLQVKELEAEQECSESFKSFAELFDAELALLMSED